MTDYTLVLALAGVLFAGGCASGPPLDQAIATHNIFRSVLLDVDGAYRPVMAEADAIAVQESKGDSAAYTKAVQPWLDATKALSFARQTELAMHLLIEQWQATGEQGKILPETYACAAEAVDQTATAFAVLPRGSPLYAALFAIGTQLRAMADGVKCGGKP